MKHPVEPNKPVKPYNYHRKPEKPSETIKNKTNLYSINLSEFLEIEITHDKESDPDYDCYVTGRFKIKDVIGFSKKLSEIIEHVQNQAMEEGIFISDGCELELSSDSAIANIFGFANLKDPEYDRKLEDYKKQLKLYNKNEKTLEKRNEQYKIKLKEYKEKMKIYNKEKEEYNK